MDAVADNVLLQEAPRKKESVYFLLNRVRLVHQGDDYFDLLLRLIDATANEIHLQYYIFSDDVAGSAVCASLSRAVSRGVKVFLVIDGYEARTLSRSFVRQLKDSGVHFRFFEPLFKSKNFYIGRRMHHKVAVFDGQRALVGGINIADRYLGVASPDSRLDMAILLEGVAVNNLRDICIGFWKDISKQEPQLFGSLSQKKLGLPQSIGQLFPASVRIRQNDWVRGKNEIWKSYFDMFNRANDSIVLMCSYFLPGWIFLREIKKAIGRGVSVKVILAGMSDVMLAKHAERYLYRWMLRNKVEIYELKGNVLHAKVCVRDHKWMTIGSYNVNNISALASIELNVDVRNRPFVSTVQDELLQIANTQCIQITPENFSLTQNAFRKFWQWSCYQVIKIVLYLATFYFRQER